ncbi:hypothetical protein HRW30_003893 [Salmonella enterica]|nr:hypothetical protein [Salmonella enterica]EEE9946670.1 hypothetical protein [Salmonella enterica subsp. enterica serovar Uzaramo]EBE7298525.1 hypothetical protein [Salmonella enterica]EFU9295021.1 hypothetical protein [Salmonella enterica]EHP5748380.1 hypothetical protein [Salmonella enterica]
MATAEKLTPLEDLMRERGKFISIREAVETVKARYPEMTYEQVAEWVYRKARSLGVVKKTFSDIAGSAVSLEKFFKRVAIGGGKVMSENDYSIMGYYRKELERVLGMDLPAPLPACHQDDIYLSTIKDKQETTPPADIAGDIKSLANKYAGWEPRFAGKKTAMEIIAALSKVIMEKSGNKYRRGNGVSASAIADSVVETLNKTDSQKYRKLISEALRETKVADAD